MSSSPSTPSPSSPRGLSRRHFLFAGLAVPAAAALGVTSARAEVKVDTADAFADAAREYGVPAPVLAAVGYCQTRWQDHDGRPSAALGYGPMHLIDGAAVAALRVQQGKDAGSADTLGAAAAASGIAVATLRSDPAANIRGAAALLAKVQHDAGRPVGMDTDPAQWYAAVASVSGLTNSAAQLEFADTVQGHLRQGAAMTLADGSKLTLEPRSVGSPGAQRARLQQRVEMTPQHGDGEVDAPAGLDVEWYPAPYEKTGEGAGDYGNHDLGNRPESPTITHIVIHNTEGPWDVVLNLVTDPTYVSWQYSLRSSDGHIWQHLQPSDVGWHAGNWYINSHSIGLEHEGYAADGTSWFSEPMYRTSAKLVRHLATKYSIPLDRAHIIGHDQVPGILTPNIPGMHWDPGPYWDWEHYFELLGAPLKRGTSARPLQVGDVVRVVPGFAGNHQPITGCTPGEPDSCVLTSTNFVTLRVAPDPAADLVNDLGLHQKGQPASTEVSDISARATAGNEFVVAELEGDWVGVWYLGVVAWLHNPADARTVRRLVKPVKTVTAKAGSDAAHVYGRCYPEPEAYTNPADVQVVEPLLYTIPAGQQYVVTDDSVPTDYYKAKTFDEDTPGDHISIAGQDEYLQISYGHRVGFVRAAEVDVSRR